MKTATTVTERVQKWRAKKACDPGFKKAESERVEKARQKRVAAMTDKEKLRYRQAASLRKRTSRAIYSTCKPKPVKDINQTSPKTISKSPKKAYRCPQSLGKAIRKSLYSLPSSPRKKKAVVEGIAKKIGIPLSPSCDRNINYEKVNLSRATMKTVMEFYFNSDIVYTSPGMKDEVTVWEQGVKKRLRKYYLTMYIKEAYSVFKSKYPKCVIGYSTFAKLRPKNVFLLKDTPTDQCKCRTHENFILKVEAIGLKYDNELWEICLCDPQDLQSLCWKGECNNCQGIFENDLNQLDKSVEIDWYEWTKTENGRIQKEKFSGCTGELVDKLLESFPGYREHVRVKRIQANAFEMDKNSAYVIQIDFAMAYSCEYQNEIQSALWSRASVNLFTVAIFNKGHCKSYLICTDSVDKGKNTVFTFLSYLSELIPSHSDVIIFSDGPSSEFKNKFAMKVISTLAKQGNRTVWWKYFATSHGKGVVDGIGGRAKSMVRRAVMSKGPQSPIVQSSVDFANVAEKILTETEVVHISQEDIDRNVEWCRSYDNVLPVPGIQKMHIAKASSNGKVELWHTSGGNVEPEITITYKTPEQELSKNCASDPQCHQHDVCTVLYTVGDWVLVSYDGSKYPGKVESIVGINIEVDAMEKSGGYWKWPKDRDIVFYTPDKVLGKISPPDVAGSRGQYRFMDF